MKSYFNKLSPNVMLWRNVTKLNERIYLNIIIIIILLIIIINIKALEFSSRCEPYLHVVLMVYIGWSRYNANERRGCSAITLRVPKVPRAHTTAKFHILNYINYNNFIIIIIIYLRESLSFSYIILLYINRITHTHYRHNGSVNNGSENFCIENNF